jgi:hypothetical protein
MKDITGYEGLYAVTSCGKVWSYKRKKFLKQADTNGYKQVCLTKDGKQKNHFVHRLVCTAYHENPNNFLEVNHKDECKMNNYANNLEWCDPKYNTNYGTCIQRRAKAQSVPVLCIELDRVFSSIKEAAEFSGVTASLVNKCLRGRSKTAGGYHWKYL